MPPDDVIRNYHFLVDAGFTRVGFDTVTGLGAEIEPVEYRSGSSPDMGSRFVPGRVRHHPVTLSRGLATDMELWQWFRQATTNDHEPRDVTINLLDPRHDPVVSFRLAAAWPSRIVFGDLDSTGNGIAIETMTLVHDGLDVVT